MSPRRFAFSFILLLTAALPAHASSGGTVLAFNDTLQTVLDNLSGPTASVVCGIAFILGCITVAFTKDHGPVKTIGITVVTVALVAKAPQLLQQLGLSGACATRFTWLAPHLGLLAASAITGALFALYLVQDNRADHSH